MLPFSHFSFFFFFFDMRLLLRNLRYRVLFKILWNGCLEKINIKCLIVLKIKTKIFYCYRSFCKRQKLFKIFYCGRLSLKICFREIVCFCFLQRFYFDFFFRMHHTVKLGKILQFWLYKAISICLFIRFFSLYRLWSEKVWGKKTSSTTI